VEERWRDARGVGAGGGGGGRQAGRQAGGGWNGERGSAEGRRGGHERWCDDGRDEDRRCCILVAMTRPPAIVRVQLIMRIIRGLLRRSTRRTELAFIHAWTDESRPGERFLSVKPVASREVTLNLAGVLFDANPLRAKKRESKESCRFPSGSVLDKPTGVM